MHQVRIPIATAPAPASEPVPATLGTPAVPPMEEQEARSDSVERKQETLMKQRSVAEPMKSDIPEADYINDKDSAVSGAIMLEATPVLEKEKTIIP